jgi:hypothetical protein
MVMRVVLITLSAGGVIVSSALWTTGREWLAFRFLSADVMALLTLLVLL